VADGAADGVRASVGVTVAASVGVPTGVSPGADGDVPAVEVADPHATTMTASAIGKSECARRVFMRTHCCRIG
jgi:hypothetical protein